MLETFADAVAATALSGWIQDAYWLWPVMEILHFIGLSLLFGGLLIVDLRLLGFFAGLDPARTRRLLSVVLIGFAINLVTGIGFFFGDPGRYVINMAFQIKMGLILLAGINAAAYHFWILPPCRGVGVKAASEGLKISALISLLAWTGVMVLGRLIPYIGTG